MDTAAFGRTPLRYILAAERLRSVVARFMKRLNTLLGPVTRLREALLFNFVAPNMCYTKYTVNDTREHPPPSPGPSFNAQVLHSKKSESSEKSGVGIIRRELLPQKRIIRFRKSFSLRGRSSFLKIDPGWGRGDDILRLLRSCSTGVRLMLCDWCFVMSLLQALQSTLDVPTRACFVPQSEFLRHRLGISFPHAFVVWSASRSLGGTPTMSRPFRSSE